MQVARSQEQGRWKERTYTPNAGDIILFDRQGDGITGHVVVSVIDGTVNTIEGNSEDMCRRKRYSVGSEVIYGYGIW